MELLHNRFMQIYLSLKETRGIKQRNTRDRLILEVKFLSPLNLFFRTGSDHLQLSTHVELVAPSNAFHVHIFKTISIDYHYNNNMCHIL